MAIEIKGCTAAESREVVELLEQRRWGDLQAAVRVQLQAAKERPAKGPIKVGDVERHLDMQMQPSFYHEWGQRLGL